MAEWTRNISLLKFCYGRLAVNNWRYYKADITCLSLVFSSFSHQFIRYLVFNYLYERLLSFLSLVDYLLRKPLNSLTLNSRFVYWSLISFANFNSAPSWLKDRGDLWVIIEDSQHFFALIFMSHKERSSYVENSPMRCVIVRPYD